MRIGERIREARETAGITQEQLAKTLGVRQGAISRWEREAQPRSENLPSLADALGVSIRWLITGKNQPAEADVPFDATGS